MKGSKNPNNLLFIPTENSKSDNVGLDEGKYIFKIQQTAIETEKLKGRRQDRKERKVYAKRIFIFIISWCSAVVIILIATGLKWVMLSDTVIITLITTTTANILTLFYLVTRYLFTRSPK